MADPKKVDEVTGTETTGHVWDGIQELNNPLPRWWLWTLYGTIIWGLAYVIAYPAWPLISGATSGVLGWSTRADVAASIEAHDAKNAALVADLVAADMDSLPENADLNRYAVARGGAVFRAQPLPGSGVFFLFSFFFFFLFLVLCCLGRLGSALPPVWCRRWAGLSPPALTHTCK